jgi:hypothetical protein
MRSKKMKIFMKLVMVFWFLQIKYFAFTQTTSNKTGVYIFAFNPVYASGLIDMGYVASEDLYLVISETPLKIDSVMSILSKKNYSTMLGILDTLKKEFKVYNLVESNSKSKTGNKINKTLTDCNHYRSGYLFSLSNTIKKSSSLVGFVISRYTFLKEGIKYKVLNENCGDFPNECRAIIISLKY